MQKVLLLIASDDKRSPPILPISSWWCQPHYENSQQHHLLDWNHSPAGDLRSPSERKPLYFVNLYQYNVVMQNSVILCLECLGPKYIIDLNQLSRFESSGAYNHTSGIISKRFRQFKENCSERSLNVRAAADVGGCLLEKIFTHNKNAHTDTNTNTLQGIEWRSCRGCKELKATY